MRFLLFNPSNDMALASDASEYMPPKRIQEMEEKYWRIPELIADEGDIVLNPDMMRGGLRDLFLTVDDSTSEVCPWGWSRSIRNKFRRLGVPCHLLPDDDYLDRLRKFSSREFCAKYREELSGCDGCVDNMMRIVSSADDVGRYYPLMLKALWSSSGRGNRIVRNDDDLKRGGIKFPCLSDVFYDKVLDFAMEFRICENHVEYLGLSVFKADSEGRYELNVVDSQENLELLVNEALRDDSANILRILKDRHLQLLSEHLVGKYVGPVGIDMMIVAGNERRLIHPCVELNFRMNMGILAIEIQKRYGPDVKTISLEILRKMTEHML